MSNLLRASIVALTVFASHCGPGNGTGFIVDGTVSVAVREGTGAPSNTGFNFPAQTRIDPTLPQGRADGFIGSCSVGPSGRSLVVQRVGGDRMGLESITVTLPDWSQDTCASCNRGTVSFVVGGTNYTGSQTAGSASPCQFTASRAGSYDMRLGVQCTGLATGTRSADLSLNLSLDLCNGPMSRN